MITSQWKEILHFKSKEFDDKDVLGSGKKMVYRFVKKLDKARDMSKMRGWHINSGGRFEKRNTKVGGKKTSSHLKWLASDIRVRNSLERGDILSCCILAGFRRIGIADTFIHVDDDPDKLKDLKEGDVCIWVY